MKHDEDIIWGDLCDAVISLLIVIAGVGVVGLIGAVILIATWWN